MTNPTANNNANITNSPADAAPEHADVNGNDIYDVCEINPEDQVDANATVIERPAPGQISEFSVEPGQDYVLGFEQVEVTSITEQDGALTVKLNCGGAVILNNYQTASTGEEASNFAFLDPLAANELASLIEPAAGETEVIAEPPQSELADAPEAETTEPAPQELVEEIAEEAAEEVADTEPAAGDEGEQVAQIEPAAGDEGGDEGDAGGFGFESTFNPTEVNGLQAIGALGETALQYGANFPEQEVFPENNQGGQGPSGPANDIPTAGPAAGRVDETGLKGGPQTVSGQIVADFGNDGPGTIEFNGDITINGQAGDGLTSCGQPVTIAQDGNSFVATDADGNVIFTLKMDPDTGEYEFTLLGPLDHMDTSDPNDLITLEFGVVVTDADGDEITTTLTIGINDDGPQARDAEASIDETDGFGGSVTGDLSIDYGADGPGSIESNGGFNSETLEEQGLELTSGGEPVEVSATDAGYVGMTPDGEVIFELTINDDGTYTFTLHGPLDHPDDMDPDDVLDLNFSFTVYDCDGDPVEMTITINVNDDGPSASNTFKAIDEGDLANGGVITFTKTLNHDFGEDGPGEIAANGDFVATFEVGGQNQELTSGGEPVTIEMSGNGYVATLPDGTVVFEITMDPLTGEYTFTMYESLDHPDHTDPDDVIWLKFGFDVIDNDGDLVTVYAVVDVHDDAPEANDDVAQADDGMAVVGNVTDNDEVGGDNDGSCVTEVEFNGETFEVPEDGTPIEIVGEFGVLTISADGTYKYEPFEGAEGTDVFTYTLKDGDGDTDTATLTIEVTADDVPIVVEPEDICLDETDMDGGNLTADGVVKVDFGDDGPGTIAGNGDVDVSGSVGPDGLTSGGEPVEITMTDDGGYIGMTPDGTVIFTLSIDSDTGEFVFDLIGTLDHADPDNPNDAITIDFGVVATDADGDQTETDITIIVKDDGPSIDTKFRAVDEDDLADGGVICLENTLNHDYGEDGPGEINPTGNFTATFEVGGQNQDITSGGELVTVVATEDGYVGTTPDGAVVFELTVNDDGSYTYKQYAGIDHPGDDDPDDVIWLKFEVEIVDKDGDTDTAIIGIDVHDSGPQASYDTQNVDESDLGPVSVKGDLDVDFGGDGPGEIDANGDFSASGSVAGDELTSGGVPVEVTAVDGGYIGMAGGEVIFTLRIDPETGEYEFTLHGPLDHADGSDPNDVISLDFGFTATDADGDGAETTITINVADDGPVANDDTVTFDQEDVSVDGNVMDNDDVGSDVEGSVTEVCFGDMVVQVPEGGTATIEGEYGTLEISSDGSYTYTLFDDVGGGGSASADPEASDVDGFQNSITLNGITISTGESDQDLSWVDTGGEGAGIGIDSPGPDSLKVWPSGEQLEVSFDEATEVTLTIADIGANNLDDGLDLVVHLADGTTQVIEFDIGTTTPVNGEIQITLNAEEFGDLNIVGVDISSVPSADGLGVASFLLANVEVEYPGSECLQDEFTYTITDADGDTSSATLEINAKDDDEPIVVEPDAVELDETDLGPSSIDGLVEANFGDDNPGTIRPDGNIEVTGSVAGGTLTSGGVPVEITETADGYVGMAGGAEVFSLTIDPDTGEYTFTQTGTVDHADGSDPNDVITLNFGVVAEDSDGDTASTDITVNILDDAPVAHDDVNTFDFEDGADGNVMTGENGGPGAADDLSNDGTAVTEVCFGDTVIDVPQDGRPVSIEGEYGTLTIDSSGEYSYEPGDIPLTQTEYSFEIDNPPGSDAAGDIKNVETSLNADTGEFTFSMTIEPSAQGFTLAINDGPNPKGHGGEMGLFYFDATDPANPVISVYNYNGLNTQTSWMDGSAEPGTQTPDTIVNSTANPDVFSNIEVTTDADGNLVMSFAMDASVIQDHDPAYGDPNDWTGLSFEDQIGMWLHPVSGLDTSYDADGYLADWSASTQGWYDSANQLTDETTIEIDPMDEFTYTITDGDGDSSTATLTLDGSGDTPAPVLTTVGTAPVLTTDAALDAAILTTAAISSNAEPALAETKTDADAEFVGTFVGAGDVKTVDGVKTDALTNDSEVKPVKSDAPLKLSITDADKAESDEDTSAGETDALSVSVEDVRADALADRISDARADALADRIKDARADALATRIENARKDATAAHRIEKAKDAAEADVANKTDAEFAGKFVSAKDVKPADVLAESKADVKLSKSDTPLKLAITETKPVDVKGDVPAHDADALADRIADARADALADRIADARADVLADRIANARADALADRIADARADAMAQRIENARKDYIEKMAHEKAQHDKIVSDAAHLGKAKPQNGAASTTMATVLMTAALVDAIEVQASDVNAVDTQNHVKLAVTDVADQADLAVLTVDSDAVKVTDVRDTLTDVRPQLSDVRPDAESLKPSETDALSGNVIKAVRDNDGDKPRYDEARTVTETDDTPVALSDQAAAVFVTDKPDTDVKAVKTDKAVSDEVVETGDDDAVQFTDVLHNDEIDVLNALDTLSPKDKAIEVQVADHKPVAEFAAPIDLRDVDTALFDGKADQDLVIRVDVMDIANDHSTVVLDSLKLTDVVQIDDVLQVTIDAYIIETTDVNAQKIVTEPQDVANDISFFNGDAASIAAFETSASLEMDEILHKTHAETAVV